MRRIPVATLLLVLCLAAWANAAMVTERWGVQGRVQHPGTLRFEPLGKQGTLVVLELSALPAGVTVYSARLFFSGVNWKDSGFDIIPAVKTDGQPQPVGKPLAPAAPWYQWLDATDAVRAWTAGGKKAGLLWMRGARAFRQDATVLEIAYEGNLPAQVPPQVTGVKAFSRSGQVFITFKEVEPLDEGRDAINWGDLAKKFKGDYYGPAPGNQRDEVRYRVYSHDRPITAANIGQAQFLGEVLPGSAFNTRMGLKSDEKRKTEELVAIQAGQSGEGLATGPSVGVLRVAVEPGTPVPPGTGVFVHTVTDAGDRYYAVLASANGVTNTRDISEANAAGPVPQRPGDPEPVLYMETAVPVAKAKYVTQWYSFWTAQPLSPWPARYDVVVGYCPDLLAKPADLHIYRYGWNSWPTPPGPQPTTAIHMSHTGDQPVDFRAGLHDSIGTIKGFDQGRWQPFHSNRQVALVKWMSARWAVDPNRLSVDMGAWGMMEIKYGHLYAMIRGWGEPELTKGFQCWDRARGIWGVPELYKGRPDDENPYVAANLTDWVLANPEKELPFVYICAGGGAHYTEEGWPPVPRFCWAMMKSKQPLLFSTARDSAVAEAINTGQLDLRRDQSLPAFANCSLDDNIGEGNLPTGNGWSKSQINGWILWDPGSIVDEPGRWEITLWVGERCPLSEGTVDLTPRRCGKFVARPRQAFQWTNAILPPTAEKKDDQKAQADRPGPTGPGGAALVQQDRAEADERGFVTIEKVKVTKGRHRVVIVPAK
jgi:hypothetical protein